MSSKTEKTKTPRPVAAIRAASPIHAARARRVVESGRERVLVPVEPAGTAKPRRTQAERSRLTRERVMLATVELMRLRGYGDLSTVEVAERAGVSRGALLHQFPTKNDLVIETMRYLDERMLAAAAARTERARELEDDPIDAIIEDAFDFFFGDYFFITLSITMSDERNAALRQGVEPLTGPSRIRIERRWVDVLVAAGWSRPQAADMLALTFSLVRGFAVRRLIQDDRRRFDELMRQWKAIASEHLRHAAMTGRAPATQSRRKRTNA